MATRRALPPLTAIKTFEAAARHGNFTLAAEELGMTQASVSYQIKVLEDRIGAPLFLRKARGVELLEAGEKLANPTSQAMDILRKAYAEAKGTVTDTLVLSVVTTFAVSFLVQRIGRFQLKNPDISVRLETNERAIDFKTSDVDIVIGCNNINGGGIYSEYLMGLDFTPMLNPILLKEYGEVQKPADLLNIPLIDDLDPWWKHWFDEAGVEYTPPEQKRKIGLGPQVVDASLAIAAHGVGILTPAFYKNEVSNGVLYQPFDLVCDDGMAYWLTFAEDQRKNKKIAVFVAWLQDEIAQFKR